MKFVLFGRLKKGGDSKTQTQETPQRPAQPQQQHISQKQPVEDRVTFLISQGLAEPEIIKVLKDEGYSFQEIDSGISTVLKSTVSDQPPEVPEENTIPDELSPLIVTEEDQRSPQKVQSEMIEQMNAIMEQMMEEKLSIFSSELDRIDSKFESIEGKIQKAIAQITDFEAAEKRDEAKEDAKIQEINAKETDLEPRIASLEKAFKDIIPGLVESIRELRETINSSKRRESFVPALNALREEVVPEEPEKKDSNIFD